MTPSRYDRLVFCVAAPAEARAVATGLGIDPGGVSPEPAGTWTPLTRTITRSDGTACELVLIQTGVGKVNAAAAVTAYLLLQLGGTPVPQITAVFSLGVAGVLPGSLLAIGDAILATVSCYADEGVALPGEDGGGGGGFADMSSLGFGYGVPITTPTMGVPGSTELRAELRRAFAGASRRLHEGPIATVSTCSGTDGLALTVVRRTGAWAEAMEGAAVGHAIHRISTFGLKFASFSHLFFSELRIISNTTGDRKRQQWNLSTAFAHLSETTRLIAGIGE